MNDADAMLARLIERYPPLASCRLQIEAARQALETAFETGGKVLLCGNGGSAADCDHIAAELLKGFERKRPLSDEMRKALAKQGDDMAELGARLHKGLPAISLVGHHALTTAFSNDVDPDLVFAQLVCALGCPGDVLVAISTSGRSRSVLLAARTARALGLVTIGLTGRGGGPLAGACDITIDAPGETTPDVQEMHLPIYHYLCRAVEATFFPE